MSNPSQVDTVVIGAGQAGLAVSRCLQKRNVSHVVLERERVGNSWRTQRWDSFHLNTPNAINLLPDDAYSGDEATGFVSHQALLTYLDEYRRRHKLPVQEGVEVTAVRPLKDGFEVVAGGTVHRCRHVVLCSGDQNAPRIPALAGHLPRDLTQLHAADYRRPGQLPAGAVLVVGSGQSGVQIVEDLLEDGRTVYLSTSAVGRCPRRYRGKDILEWFQIAGLLDQRPEDLENPAEVRAPQPQISGTRGGHSVSLHQLAREGARLLGHLQGAAGRVLRFEGDLAANVAKGDEMCARLKGMADMLISKAGMNAPPAETDPADEPFPGMAGMASVTELDVDTAEIRSILWATGFGPRFDYLPPEILDDSGRPRHKDGICDVPGLYCLGFTWLRRRGSGLIAGASGDADPIAAHIAARAS